MAYKFLTAYVEFTGRIDDSLREAMAEIQQSAQAMGEKTGKSFGAEVTSPFRAEVQAMQKEIDNLNRTIAALQRASKDTGAGGGLMGDTGRAVKDVERAINMMESSVPGGGLGNEFQINLRAQERTTKAWEQSIRAIQKEKLREEQAERQYDINEKIGAQKKVSAEELKAERERESFRGREAENNLKAQDRTTKAWDQSLLAMQKERLREEQVEREYDIKTNARTQAKMSSDSLRQERVETEANLKERKALADDMEKSSVKAWEAEKKDREKFAKDQAAWQREADREEGGGGGGRGDGGVPGPFEAWGRGTPPRVGIAAYLKSQGMGDLMAGALGLVGGGIALQIGYAITSALMNIPSLIAEGFRDVESEAMGTSAIPDPEQMGEAKSLMRSGGDFWSQTALPGGRKTYYAGYQQFSMQSMRINKSQKEIKDIMDRLAGIAIADPNANLTEMAAAYAEMLATNDQDAKGRLYGSSKLIQDAMQFEMYPGAYARRGGRTGLTDRAKTLETKAFEDAVKVATVSPAVQGAVKTQTEGSASTVRTAWDRLWEGFKEFPTTLKNTIKSSFSSSDAKYYFGPGTREPSENGMPEAITSAPPMGPFERGYVPSGQAFQFTTLAGLAEMMQTQAATGPTLDIENNSYLERIADATEKTAGKETEKENVKAPSSNEAAPP